MGRKKGSKNKQSITRSSGDDLSNEERLSFIANLIIDQIIEDRLSIDELSKQLEVVRDEQLIAA